MRPVAPPPVKLRAGTGDAHLAESRLSPARWVPLARRAASGHHPAGTRSRRLAPLPADPGPESGGSPLCLARPGVVHGLAPPTPPRGPPRAPAQAGARRPRSARRATAGSRRSTAPRLCSSPAPAGCPRPGPAPARTPRPRSPGPRPPAHLLDGLLRDLPFASRPGGREGHRHGRGCGISPRSSGFILRLLSAARGAHSPQSLGAGGVGGAAPWARPPLRRRVALGPAAPPPRPPPQPEDEPHTAPPGGRSAPRSRPAATPPPPAPGRQWFRPAPPRRARTSARRRPTPPDASGHRLTLAAQCPALGAGARGGRSGVVNRGLRGRECALFPVLIASPRRHELRPRHHRLLARRPPLPSGVRAGGREEGLDRGERGGRAPGQAEARAAGWGPGASCRPASLASALTGARWCGVWGGTMVWGALGSRDVGVAAGKGRCEPRAGDVRTGGAALWAPASASGRAGRLVARQALCRPLASVPRVRVRSRARAWRRRHLGGGPRVDLGGWGPGGAGARDSERQGPPVARSGTLLKGVSDSANCVWTAPR